MICFTRSGSFYQVARTEEGFVGYRDGQVVARAGDCVEVVRALLDRHPPLQGAANAAPHLDQPASTKASPSGSPLE